MKELRKLNLVFIIFGACWSENVVGLNTTPIFQASHLSKALAINIALFRNKGFFVNLKTERIASKFAMFMEKKPM